MNSKFITLIGVIFTIYGIILGVMSNLNFGLISVVAIGIFTLCIGVFYSKIKKLTSTGFFKICKFVFIFFLCIEIVLLSFLAIYGCFDNTDYNEDAVIVLGAAVNDGKITLPLKLRLDKAIEYHHKNPDAIIIVTGGQGHQETVTEAYLMEKYLIENGVDKNLIFKEEKATSTFENMKFSKEILDSYFTNDYSIVVITNNFHIFRGTTLAKNIGFQSVKHMHAGLQWYNIMPCFLRESLAMIKMYIVDLNSLS